MNELAMMTAGGLAGLALVIGLLYLIFAYAPAMATTDNAWSGTTQLGEGRVEVWGSAHFVTTGATLALPVRLRRIEAYQLTWMGTPASDEILSGPDIPDGSSLLVTGTGTVTITRTGASKTSALGFCYRMVGYS